MASRVTFDLNPRFVFFSPLNGSPLKGTTANSQAIAEHVDHAIIALDGRAPFAGEVTLEELAPVANGDMLRVELWVNDLDDCTCTYGFLVSSEDGRVPHARGERTIVNVDRASHSPARWNPDFRIKHENLRRDLPAYG